MFFDQNCVSTRSAQGATPAISTGSRNSPCPTLPKVRLYDRYMPCAEKALFETPSLNSESTEYEKMLYHALTDRNWGERGPRILGFRQDSQPVVENYIHSRSYFESLGLLKDRIRRLKVERVLDAPDFNFDFYGNSLSYNGVVLAIILGEKIFFKNQGSGATSEIPVVDSRPVSLPHNLQEFCLTVSYQNGTVRIWDVQQELKLQRTMECPVRVNTLLYSKGRPQVLFGGDTLGSIRLLDVRAQEAHIGDFLAHTDKICGLVESGERLISSGNEALVKMWDVRSLNSPLAVFPHEKAVRALVCCSSNPSLVATGTGSGDHKIRIIDLDKKRVLSQTDTEAEVTNLFWKDKELVSTQGIRPGAYTEIESGFINMWRWSPQTHALTCLGSVSGHQERVADADCHDDTIVTVSLDETVCFWKLWDENLKPSAWSTGAERKSTGFSSRLRSTIR